MTRKQVKILISTFSILLVLINLPFLPGPYFLHGLAQVFFTIGQILGLIGILTVPIGIIWTTINKTKKIKLFRPLLFTTIFFVPLISVFVLTNQLRDISRTIAIKNGNKLVRQIENYDKKNGYYPDNIDNSIFDIPYSWIIGVGQYSYRKTEHNFELTFTQNVFLGFNFEIVTYNNKNEQKAQGEQKTLYTTSDKHWKYEIFD